MKLCVFPWALEGVDIGANVLEMGPGYGTSTEVLLPQCEHLTVLESDHRLAAYLQERMPVTKTTILRGDASAMALLDAQFDAAVCFMMLHHVNPAPLQDRLFSETMRVLKPGGVFAGADSPSSFMLRILHIGEKVSMIDPMTLADRLEAAGFEDVRVDAGRYAFRFCARKPMNSLWPERLSADERYEDNERDIMLSQVT